MTLYDPQADIELLTNDLLRYTAGRQWEIQTVTFPSTPGQDKEILHSLTPTNPEHVDWLVLQSTGPVGVYKDTSATRVPWQAGVMRLRCTGASAQVVLLLRVDANEDGRVDPVGDMPNFTLSDGQGKYVGLGVAYGSSTDSDIDPSLPGIELVNGTVTDYQILAEGSGPTSGISNGLAFYDKLNQRVPFRMGYSAAYDAFYFQPGYLGQSIDDNVYLGNPNEGTPTGGWFTAAYVRKYYEDDRSTAMGYWTSYTPAWTASVSNPSLGNGTLSGRYSKVGKTVTAKLSLTIGSTSTLGTGLWLFSLPSTRATTDADEVGSGMGFINATSAYYHFGSIPFSSTTVGLIYQGTTTGVNSGAPAAWGNGDVLRLTVTYEEA